MRVVLAALLAVFLARGCLASSGGLPVNAGAAAMGGVSIVGECASPHRVALSPKRGLEFETSWSNPYGLEGLYASAVSLRGGRGRTSIAVSLQSLETPTPYGEFGALASLSFAATEALTLGAGSQRVWFSDSEGVFARETFISIGFALGRPEYLELACTAVTPLREGVGAFRWGFAAPISNGARVAVEEERRDTGAVRRFGGEIDLTETIAVRSGLAGPPAVVSLGAGVRTGRVNFDFAVTQHEVLGATPYVTVSYRGPRSVPGTPGR
jgi:hypothetical protein